MPYASAFMAKVALAVWAEAGTEMAHWLFWQTYTIGAFQTPTMFMPA